MCMEVTFQNGDFLEGHFFSSYLNMEIMLQHVTFVFIKVTNSLERHNYIITCFDKITSFKLH